MSTTSLRKITLKTGVTKKTPVLFRPKILSRHPSHNILRAGTRNLPLSRHKVVIRFGSTTEVEDTIANGGRRIEINSVQAVKNSANKLLMKQCFERAGVKTASWRQANHVFSVNAEGITFSVLDNKPTTINFPVVGKQHFGSKGSGNTLIHNLEEYQRWITSVNAGNCIIEQYMNYGHEFRLHISDDGCFYTCRKALKADVPEEDKWHRHDSNCVWFLESNEQFFKPNSWNNIVEDCVKALRQIGADILSFDVRVQTPTSNGLRREYQDYVLIECNSASSMDNGTGEISFCAQKYIEEIPKIIEKKVNR